MQNGPRALPDTGVVRQSARPAASSVAATVSPSRAANGLPSMVTASRRALGMETASSGSLLYIEALRRKRLKPWFQFTRNDLRCEFERVGRGQGYTGVAGRQKRTRMSTRLIVNRKSVRAHHAQRRPSAVDAHVAQRWEGTHRAVGQGGKNGHADGVAKARFLLRIADEYRAFVGLSQRRDRMVQKSTHAFEYQDLSPLWADRCNESNLRCELGITQTRRQHDLAGPKRLVLRLQIKAF